MTTSDIDVRLTDDEEIVFESEGAVLTNQRLVSGWSAGRKRAKIPSDVPLRDIASFQKISGGHESRLDVGIGALAVGVVLNLLSIILQAGIPSLVENVVFLIGMMSLILGLYFTLTSIVRVRPHTTILFMVPGGTDVPVLFPGRENPKADQLTRLFARTKRGI